MNDIQTYIPYISLFISIVSIILYVISIWYLPKKRAIDQYKIHVIREIYPKLLSDLNEGMEEWRNRKIRNVFSELREIKKSGEVYFIKVNHEKLYKYLMRIQDEIVPSMEKVSKERDASEYDNVKSIWSKILLAKCPTHDMDLRERVIVNVENVLDSLFNHGHYYGYLTNEDTTRFKELLDSQIQSHLLIIKNYVLPPNIVEILLDRASKNREEVQTILIEIENQFKEIINDGAIPLLHNKIGKPI